MRKSAASRGVLSYNKVMAEVCPSCGTAVEHDFGVTTCAGCGVVLFVDFDGKVQISAPETVAADPVSEPAATEIAPVAFETTFEQNYESPAESADVSLELPPIPESFDSLAEPNFENPVEPSYETAYEQTEESAAVIPPPSDFSSEDYLGTNESVAPVEAAFVNEAPVQAKQGPDETMLDFSDVVDFANRSELDNNSLYYLLRIEGIDHKDIRRKVESVLADPKLNFHLQELLPTIRGGVLELTNLSPVKASVIASRLREESVEFRWSQSIYDTSSAEGNDQTGADDESQSNVG